MDPEWPLAERHVDDAHDLAGDFRRIGVGGLKASEALKRPVGDPGVGAGFVFRDPVLVGGSAGVGEMVGALGEGATAASNLPSRARARARPLAAALNRTGKTTAKGHSWIRTRAASLR